jgi:hypothetical protein
MRAIIDDGLRFAVHGMVAQRIAAGDTHFSGVSNWARNGKRIASVSYSVEVVAEDHANLRLRYQAGDKPVDYFIALVGEPCRFGGRRWFAICPRTGRKVSKLYNPAGATQFLARSAWCVAYRSQNTSATGIDRPCNARNRILDKLHSDDPDLPIKPKWMRWRTYQAHVTQIEFLQGRINGVMARHLARIRN